MDKSYALDERSHDVAGVLDISSDSSCRFTDSFHVVSDGISCAAHTGGNRFVKVDAVFDGLPNTLSSCSSDFSIFLICNSVIAEISAMIWLNSFAAAVAA